MLLSACSCPPRVTKHVRLVAATRNEEFAVSNEVDVVPDSGEASVARSTDDSINFEPVQDPQAGAPDAVATPPAKRRARLVVLIVVGVLAFAGAWWASNAVLGLLNPSATGEPAREGGYTFTSSTAGYEVGFPGEPEVTSSPIMVGTLDIEQTTATWADEAAAYSVTTAELPADIVAAAGDAILTSSVDGMVANIPGAELIEQTDGSLDGERAVTGMVAADASDIWYTVAMHGNTQVIITLIVPTGESAPEFAQTFRFLD
jgi:hypothetical protein